MAGLLNDTENEAASEFMWAHYKGACRKQKKIRAASVEVRCEANGVALSVSVRCPACGETKNISDFDSW